MLPRTFRLWATLLLLLTMIPALSSARNQNEKEPLDLSKLQQADALASYMTNSQKLQFIQLDQAIKDAESDRRSGELMMQTKPSKLNPNQDVRPTIERGKQLVAESDANIYEAQKKLIELLEQVEVRKKNQITVNKTKYDYDLKSAPWSEALADLSRQVLEASWEQGYETLFFDGAFILDAEGPRKVEAGLRNTIYDALVEVDGTNFSVTIPVDLALQADTDGKGPHIFTF